MPLKTTTSKVRAHSRSMIALALGGLFLGSPSVAPAQALVSVSPDITIALGAANVVTADETVAVDNQLGIVALENLGPIPASADVVGYGELLGGVKIMSFDTTVALSGGVFARPGDVVAWDGSVHSIAFDATAAGIPNGVQADAVSLAAGGGLLLSFDTDVSLPGALTVADEDLVRWNGSSFSLAFDGSAAGVDRALDVDATDDLGGNVFLVSFGTAGSVGGVAFQDEDVLRYAGGVWSLEVDGSALDADWVAADLVAVHVPEPSGIAGAFVGALALFAARRGARRTRERSSSRHRTNESDRVRSCVLFVAGLWMAGLPGHPAFAGDGVLQINQTCAVETGCFSGDAPGLPVTIDGSTGQSSFRLTSDLLVPDEDTNGIQISVDDVGIDLNNFTIRGPVSCSGTPLSCGTNGGTGSGVAVVLDTQSGISVRNGSIWGMGNYGVFLGVQSEVIGVRARSNFSGGIHVADVSTVTRNIVYGNGNFGLRTGWGAIVTGNTASGNGGTGISIGSESTVSGNTAHQNGGDGIFAWSGSTITGNTAVGNGADGIETNLGSTVAGNTAYQNAGDGIKATETSGVLGNTVRSNTGFGIVGEARPEWPSTNVTFNVVTNNAAGTVIGEIYVGNACNGSSTCP